MAAEILLSDEELASEEAAAKALADASAAQESKEEVVVENEAVSKAPAAAPVEDSATVKLSAEVAALRAALEAQVATKVTPAEVVAEETDIDILTNPREAIRAVVAQALAADRQAASEYASKTAKANDELLSVHSDANTVLTSKEFAEFRQANPLVDSALRVARDSFDVKSVANGIALFKATKAKASASEANDAAAKALADAVDSAPDAQGSSVAKKVYRNADIQNMINTDYDKYVSMEAELAQAYQEGRVVA